MDGDDVHNGENGMSSREPDILISKWVDNMSCTRGESPWHIARPHGTAHLRGLNDCLPSGLLDVFPLIIGYAEYIFCYRMSRNQAHWQWDWEMEWVGETSFGRFAKDGGVSICIDPAIARPINANNECILASSGHAHHARMNIHEIDTTVHDSAYWLRQAQKTISYRCLSLAQRHAANTVKSEPTTNGAGNAADTVSPTNNKPINSDVLLHQIALPKGWVDDPGLFRVPSVRSLAFQTNKSKPEPDCHASFPSWLVDDKQPDPTCDVWCIQTPDKVDKDSWMTSDCASLEREWGRAISVYFQWNSLCNRVACPKAKHPAMQMQRRGLHTLSTRRTLSTDATNLASFEEVLSHLHQQTRKPKVAIAPRRCNPCQKNTAVKKSRCRKTATIDAPMLQWPPPASTEKIFVPVCHFQCGTCPLAWYCSQECQTLDIGAPPLVPLL